MIFFWPWAGFWSWVSKDQFLNVSVYRNNFQIINDIWTLETPLSATVFLNILMNWSSNVAYALFNTNRHHLTDIFFMIFSIFLSRLCLDLFISNLCGSFFIIIFIFSIFNNISFSRHTCCKSGENTICLLLVLWNIYIFQLILDHCRIYHLMFFIFHQNFMYQKYVNNLCCWCLLE